jgi:hypothetical protein
VQLKNNKSASECYYFQVIQAPQKGH